jgi:hypothetical protein
MGTITAPAQGTPAAAGGPPIGSAAGRGGVSPLGGIGGIGGVGGAAGSGGSGGAISAPPPVSQPAPDPAVLLNTQPDTSNPFLVNLRPDIENRPARPPAPPALPPGSAYVEPGSFDATKAAMIGGAVLAVLLVVWMLFLVVTPSIPAPTGYTSYATSTGAFAIDVPDGWNQDALDTKREDALTGQVGESDQDGIRIWDGKALVNVRTDSGGDEMKQQLLGGGIPNLAGLVDDKQKAFVARLQKRLGNFDQTDAAGVSIPGFDARTIEYTGSTGPFGITKVHGYGATIHGPKHFMTVFLECPQKNWSDLQPAYEHMLTTVKLDGVDGPTLQQRLRDLGVTAPSGGAGGSINVPGAGAIQIPSGVGGF